MLGRAEGALALLLASGLGCGERVSQPSDLEDGVAIGRWGGRGVLVMLTSSGGTVELDCAHGTILEPVRPDGDGRFRVMGTYTPERPGPSRAGDVSETQAVTYEGAIQGSQMNLTVQSAEGTQSVGTFELTRDSAGVLRRCL